MQRKRCFTSFFLCKVFSILLAVATFPALADDIESEVRRIVDNHETSKLLIDEYATAKGEQRLLLHLRVQSLLDYQTEVLPGLLEELANPDATVSDETRTLLTNTLVAQGQILNRSYQQRNSDLEDKRAAFDGLDSKQALKNELAMANVERGINRLLSLRLALLGWESKLGVDVTEQSALLVANVTLRANELSLLLNFANTRIGELAAELPKATSYEKEDIEYALRRLRIKREICTESIEAAVTVLESLDVNSDYFKQVLITSTGAVSEDIFEVKVLSRLLENWTEAATNWFGENSISFIVKLIVFCAILFGFHLLADVARTVATKAVSNSKLKLSKLLQEFFISMAGKVVFFIGLMIGLSQLGVQLAPLLAGFGVAGIVIGFALQGTLSNFASGMMILIYRPFDVGDMVIAGGVQGNVKKLSLVSATIQTIDNQRIVVPNNMIWNDVITNITAEKVRRVDMVFGISYKDDIDHAERVLHDVVSSHPAVLKRPEIMIKVANLGESSVDFWVRPWVKTEDYWDVFWDLTKSVKQRFDKEGICIPFPQRDVHLFPSADPVTVDVKPSSNGNLPADQ
ncbi:mechanosensitive ion channel family protein [Corallincola holothuriorum]|nr:mechanosensitive ion channel domain-containing protein [Corallincola holothuriorum]